MWGTRRSDHGNHHGRVLIAKVALAQGLMTVCEVVLSNSRRFLATRRGWLISVALGLAIALAGCSDRKIEQPSPPALIVSEGNSTRTMSAATLSVAQALTVSVIRAERPVRLLRATMLTADAELEVVAARVSFLRSESRRLYAGLPGYFCGAWPPDRWGTNPSYALEGLEIDSDERFAITLVVLATKAGEWEGRGLQLEYEDAGTKRSASDDSVGVKILRRRTLAELPGGKSDCNNPKTPYGWWEVDD